MELFDKKFVYFMWDDKLKDKSAFCANSIPDLTSVVNSENQDYFHTLSRSLNSAWPFHSEEKLCDWRFIYYDPLYNYKVAFNRGGIVSYRSKGSSDLWIRVTHPMWDDEKYEYLLGCKDLIPIAATNMEVAEWLSKGNGQIRLACTISTDYEYGASMDKAVCNYSVRKWEDKEWHVATYEYLGIEVL